ncbi:hypothetical protein ACVWWD_005011 [Mesorhizobium sp. URHB0026]
MRKATVAIAIGHGLRRIEFPEHVARLVLVSGRTAERRQEVRRERHEPFQGHAPGDVADMRVETPVFMDDDDRAELAGLVRGFDQIALHLAAAAGIGDVLALYAGIGLGHDRRLGRVRRQHRRDGGRRRARSGKPGQLLHEAAAIQRQMRVFVIGIDHCLGDDGFGGDVGHGLPRSRLDRGVLPVAR